LGVQSQDEESPMLNVVLREFANVLSMRYVVRLTTCPPHLDFDVDLLRSLANDQVWEVHAIFQQLAVGGLCPQSSRRAALKYQCVVQEALHVLLVHRGKPPFLRPADHVAKRADKVHFGLIGRPL